MALVNLATLEIDSRCRVRGCKLGGLLEKQHALSIHNVDSEISLADFGIREMIIPIEEACLSLLAIHIYDEQQSRLAYPQISQ